MRSVHEIMRNFLDVLNMVYKDRGDSLSKGAFKNVPPRKIHSKTHESCNIVKFAYLYYSRFIAQNNLETTSLQNKNKKVNREI